MSTTPRGTMGPASEPNVTPMIDVLLVLLIVFMLASQARMAMTLQLARPYDGGECATCDARIVLEVRADGGFAINGEAVAREALAARLQEIYAPRPVKALMVRGDSAVSYQAVISAIDVARGAGVRIVGVPTR